MGIQFLNWEPSKNERYVKASALALPLSSNPPLHPQITPFLPPLPLAQMGLGDSDVGARHRVCSSVGFRWQPPPQPCLL